MRTAEELWQEYWLNQLINVRKLSWAAGFYDGEGCCICRDEYSKARKKSYRRLQLTVNQLHDNIEVLYKFKHAVGNLGTIAGPYIGGSNSRPQSRFEARSFEHVQAIVAMLWNELGTMKREQARQALLKYLETAQGTRQRDSEGRYR